MIAATNLALIIDRTSTPIQLHHWFDLTGHIWEPSPSPIPRQARSVIYWGGEMAPLAFKIEVPRSKRYRSQTWRLDIHRVFAMMNGNPPYLQRNISHDTFPDLPRMLPRHIMPMRHLRLFRCSDALKYRWNWWWAQQGLSLTRSPSKPTHLSNVCCPMFPWASIYYCLVFIWTFLVPSSRLFPLSSSWLFSIWNWQCGVGPVEIVSPIMLCQPGSNSRLDFKHLFTALGVLFCFLILAQVVGPTFISLHLELKNGI